LTGPFQRNVCISRESRCGHQTPVAVFWDEASGSYAGLDDHCRSLPTELSSLFLLFSHADRTGELRGLGCGSQTVSPLFGAGEVGEINFGILQNLVQISFRVY